MRVESLADLPDLVSDQKKCEAVPCLPPALKVFAIEAVTPGGGKGVSGHDSMEVTSLRRLLGDIKNQFDVLPIDEISGRESNRSQSILIFAGAYQGHLRYIAPMLEAMDLVGHFFISLRQIGLPGRMDLVDITDISRSQAVRLGIDLTPTPLTTSRALAECLEKTDKVLQHCVGYAPQIVYTPEVNIPRRFRFLLSQSGVTSIVSPAFSGHSQQDECWMLKAVSPVHRRLFEFPSS